MLLQLLILDLNPVLLQLLILDLTIINTGQYYNQYIINIDI